MYIHKYMSVLDHVQILSGDAMVIRGQPCGGPPPTRTVVLSNITAPRLARRANPNVEGSSDTRDEVSSVLWVSFAWCSRCDSVHDIFILYCCDLSTEFELLMLSQQCSSVYFPTPH